MGSTTRFDYTMLGDSVNLASRLEGANKQFGTYTMISEETVKLLDRPPALRELARLAVKGRTRPVTVYEPLESQIPQTRREVLDVFGRGLKHFYDGRLAEAVQSFESIADRDPAAAAYLSRAAAIGGLVPSDWQGVWVADTK
jgi:adenylate cyclase